MFKLLLIFHVPAVVAIVDARREAIQAHRENFALAHSSASTAFRGSRGGAIVGAKSSADDVSDQKVRFESWHCTAVVAIWLVSSCCAVTVQQNDSPNTGNFLQFAIVLSCIVYVYNSGLWEAWYAGEKLTFWCQFACWLVFFALACWICQCACLCCLLGGAVAGAAVAAAIKNESIKNMHAEYEEKKRSLSGPRRDYFESDLFRQKCEALFDTLDTDRNGSLDMSELRPMVKIELPTMDLDDTVGTLRRAFDENGNSKVEKGEFVHMMQYVRMMKFNPGDFTEEGAWEVMQLDPKTATHSDVKKAYHELSLKYHPDKRTDGTKEEIARDMQEINDAKALLDKKFAN